MRRAMLALAGTVTLLPATASAQAQGMSVQTFLNKVDALKAKGMMAMFSPDVAVIKSELKNAGLQLQAEKAAREAAGKPPIACPPKDGKGKMGGEEFIGALKRSRRRSGA